MSGPQRGARDGPPTVAVTGGICSGKSLVAQLFVERGASMVDADVVARELTAPGMPALEAIRGAFGAELFDARGALDRAALRRRVFADAKQRRRLEAILQPAIYAEIAARLGRLTRSDAPYALAVIPLLVETGHAGRFDRILTVDAPEALQIERLIARDGGTEAHARAVLAAQTTRARRLAVADDVIVNDGDAQALVAPVERLHRRYLTL